MIPYLCIADEYFVIFHLNKQTMRNKQRTFSVLTGLRRFSVLMLVFLGFVGYTHAQDVTVSGTVTAKDGNEPLTGVSILLVGSSRGAVTDIDGKYSINAPTNGTLKFSYTGYTEQTVAINGQTTLNLVLEVNTSVLNEVVVVGYGTQEAKDVTGAVTKIKSEVLKEVPAPNLIAQLKGRTAGVSIVNNSSTPGAAGQIRIRGNRTLTTNQGSSDALDGPLIVVDGIPYGGSINDLNPEDITSLDILKDASATAIYGSRGAGGVILVTTRRGKSGKAVITYDGFHGLTNIMSKYNVMNGAEYAQFKTDAANYNRSSWPSSNGTSSYLLTQQEKDALAAGVSTDWQDLIYRTGSNSSHLLSLSGGSESTQYGLSGGYYVEEGVIPNQNFERFSLRTTIDHRIGKSLKIGLNTMNTLTYSNTVGGGGVPSGLVRLTPLASPYNADGTVNLNPAIGSIDAAAVSPLTLITKANSLLANNRRLRTFNSLYAELKIVEGLRYRFNAGLDFRQDNGNGYSGPLTYVNTSVVQSSSNAEVNNAEAWSYNFQHLLYYDKVFAKKHKLGITGLFEVTKDHNQRSQFNVTGIPADYIANANFALAAGQPTATGSFSETGLLSFMGRVNYSFASKYLATLTFRRDGSSTLSPGFQYFNYPAVGLGWTVTEEGFMKNIKAISNLKIRGGWGISGNRNVGAYATLGGLSAGYYNFGQSTAGQQLAYLVTSLPSSTLSWQSTDQIDLGLEFGLFNDRITGSVDYYHQKTKDILLSVPLPASNGASSTLQNLGRTEGKGLEVMITTQNIQKTNGFNWSTDWIFFFNREKITQLTTPAELENKGAGWFVGQPLTVIYDYKKVGIWQLQDSINEQIKKQTAPVQYPGQIRIEDANGDGKIDANDRQILGNFQPQWEGGLTNRFSYKGFDLSIVIYARMGMKVLAPHLTADGGGNGFPFFNQSRVNQLKVDYWTRTNPTNAFPAPDAGTDRLLFGSTLGYQDGSFIKCRSINFGYQLPSSLMSKMGLASARIYLNATNPFVIYSPFVDAGFGPDPEGNGYGGGVAPTGAGDVGAPGRQISVNLNNPAFRQFTFGLNLKF